LGLVGIANDARASDFTDFQSAREPYEQGNYADAVLAFEALVGGEIPRLTDRNIIQESRKYLGAAYVFVDRETDAEVQFERIVREDRDQRMAAGTFTNDVVAVFDRVRQRVITDMEAEADAEAERQRQRDAANIARLQQDSERLQRLLELAQTSEIREDNSRWIATIPFGVGQFQNENTGLGAFFLTAEVVFGAGSIATYAAWATLVDRAARARLEGESFDENAYLTQETVLRVANQVSFGLFLASVVAGIIEAHVSFKPERVTRQERELPDDILPPPEPHPEVEVGISPFGVSVHGTF